MSTWLERGQGIVAFYRHLTRRGPCGCQKQWSPVESLPSGWGLGLLYDHLFGLHILQKGALQPEETCLMWCQWTWPFLCGLWWLMDLGDAPFSATQFALYSDKHVPPLSWCVVSKQALHLRSPAKPNIRPAFLSGCVLDGHFFGSCGFHADDQIGAFTADLWVFVGWMPVLSLPSLNPRVGYTYCRSCPLYLFFSILHHTAPNFTMYHQQLVCNTHLLVRYSGPWTIRSLVLFTNLDI